MSLKHISHWGRIDKDLSCRKASFHANDNAIPVGKDIPQKLLVTRFRLEETLLLYFPLGRDIITFEVGFHFGGTFPLRHL